MCRSGRFPLRSVESSSSGRTGTVKVPGVK